MKKMTILATAGCLSACPSFAYDVVIDTFSSAVNTTPQVSFFGVPVMATDTGLADVLGGSRALAVESDALNPLSEAGIIEEGLFNYMSQGTGFASVTYDGEGGGFGNLLACAEAFEVGYSRADDDAQGIGTGQVQIVLALTGGGSVSVSRPIAATAGLLVFPVTEFAGVDLLNLTAVALTIDATSSDSADLSIDGIRAVGCEAPPSPSPAMGPIALGLGSLVLAGLGLLGVARRRVS